ncbi:unnamed protein product [Rhizoctonia solani]|uniref:Protein SYM1 n=1 Tax=Rhizoctonia solani TaxID=456999 RepID=A0A8H3GTV1_9AGAM|nr:unnamed protein product [Rhizoctonia solani]
MQAYMRLMNRRPLLGPCITTAFLFGTGDVVAQQAVDRKGLKGHDWVRTARLSLYGGTVFAPLVVNCFGTTDNVLTIQNNPHRYKGNAFVPLPLSPHHIYLHHAGRRELFLYQAFSPVLIKLLGFGGAHRVVCLQLLDRLPVKSKPALVASRVALDQFAFAPIAVGLFFTCTGLMEGKSIEQVKKKLDSSYKDTLIANWTLFIPFQTINMVIPLHHRLLAVNAISIPWNTFLSWKGATPAPKTLVTV